jgi:hypothetical protein
MQMALTAGVIMWRFIPLTAIKMQAITRVSLQGTYIELCCWRTFTKCSPLPLKVNTPEFLPWKLRVHIPHLDWRPEQVRTTLLGCAEPEMTVSISVTGTILQIAVVICTLWSHTNGDEIGFKRKPCKEKSLDILAPAFVIEIVVTSWKSDVNVSAQCVGFPSCVSVQYMGSIHVFVFQCTAYM